MKTNLFFKILIIGIFINTNVNGQKFVENEIFIKIKSNFNIEIPEYDSKANTKNTQLPEIQSIINKTSIKKIYKPFVTKNDEVQKIYKVEFESSEDRTQIIREFNSIAYIEYAEKIPIYRLLTTANDVQNEQWYFDYVNAYDAWDFPINKTDVTVAIIDDAVRVTHEDIANNIWQNPNEIAGNNADDDNNGFIDDVSGWDFADNDNNPDAPILNFWQPQTNWTHGTHCSGLIAGVTNNNLGIASVSNNRIKLIPIKGTADNMFASFDINDFLNGVDYAVSLGANVISMSWGEELEDNYLTMQVLIDAGHAQGTIFVAAAGNNGVENQFYPACYNHVIAVGATSINDKKADFSQYGSWIDVMAPGDSIYSCLAHDTKYGIMSGTSMACPMVAGICGFMLSYAPNASPELIENCLKCGCENIDSQNPDYIGKMGAGRVNLYNAMLCLQDSMPQTAIKTTNINKINCYVYPTNNLIQVQFSKNININQMILFNANGQKIQAIQNITNTNNYALPKPNANGLYILHIKTNNQLITKKITIF